MGEAARASCLKKAYTRCVRCTPTLCIALHTQARAAAPTEQPGGSGSEKQSDGAMMLPRKEQHIRVSSDRLSPAQFVLQPGGRVVISVAQGGPQQAFSIGRDVEEAFVTPVIPPGSSYEW